MRIYLTLIQVLLFYSTYAQQNNVTSIKASYDPAAVAELYNNIPVGLEIKYTNGQVRKTEGFLQGNYRWNRIKVSSSNGSWQNGTLLVNRQQLVAANYQVQLTVTLPDTDQPFITALTLPHLESIRFNHYADSLKRGFRFYLNVEGIFSSGKIYPLDTTTVKFETSAGKLLGQDLLLNSNDAVTRFITVTATNKNDTSMSISGTIPVKQLSDQ